MGTEKVGRTRTQQTGTRDWTNMSEGKWMKTRGWWGRVKKPKEQVEPNIEGMGGMKSNEGVDWATVSPTKQLARH